MKNRIFKCLIGSAAIILSNSLAGSAYAREPHSKIDHRSSDSIYTSGQTITLQDAIDKAIKFSPKLKASKAGFLAALGASRQADMWNNPELAIDVENIGGDGQYSGADSAEYTYSLSKSLDLNGRGDAQKKVALEVNKVASSFNDIKELEIIRDVHIAYTKVLAEAEELKLSIEQQDLAEQVLDLVSKRVAAARESNIQKIKATIAYDTSIIKSEQKVQRLQSRKTNLARLMGDNLLNGSLDHSHFFELVAPKPLTDYVALLDESPLLKRFGYLTTEKEFAFDLERTKRVSNPKVNLGIREFNNSNDMAMVAGLSLDLPIFNQNQGNIERASAELSQAKNNQDQTRLSLDIDLNEQWKNWQVSYLAAEKLSSSIIPSAKRVFKIARDGYESGKLPYIEVLDAQRTLFDAKSKYHEALKQYHIARSNIEFITTPLKRPLHNSTFFP